MRRAILLLGATLLASPAHAGGLQLGRPRVVEGRVELDVAWRNAWSNERNHDAAWIVLRTPDATGGSVLRLDPRGAARAVGARAGKVVISEDGVGCFLHLGEPWRGDVSWTVSLPLSGEVSAPADLEACALEMVLVPAGPFELGDDHPQAREFGSFYRCGAEGGPAGTFRVESEAEIPIGASAGSLHYDDGGRAIYRGDRQGPLPAAFPKGTRAFYLMKYELRQGTYAAFLDSLPESWRARRAPLDLEDEQASTCGIERLEDGRFAARAPERPANFVTWDDTAAFADWMGLRPMTELEFEKAARGPARPVPLDYPWGTAARDAFQRRVLPSRDLAHADEASESDLSDATRERHGASWCWVLDLSGSLWERVVSAGHPLGRAFRGTHGDGALDPESGDATNADWPRGDASARAADGIGFRGGAEYFKGPPDLTNPESRVGVRTYAAWNGAMRAPTYSARACRTAPGG
jgi:formylglycine-generating enzyme required for sulfatase activity